MDGIDEVQYLCLAPLSARGNVDLLPWRPSWMTFPFHEGPSGPIRARIRYLRKEPCFIPSGWSFNHAFLFWKFLKMAPSTSQTMSGFSKTVRPTDLLQKCLVEKRTRILSVTKLDLVLRTAWGCSEPSQAAPAFAVVWCHWLVDVNHPWERGLSYTCWDGVGSVHCRAGEELLAQKLQFLSVPSPCVSSTQSPRTVTAHEPPEHTEPPWSATTFQNLHS